MKLKKLNVIGWGKAAILMLLLSITSFSQWSLQLPVQHRSQQEYWSCGVNTIAMWSGYINKSSMNVYSIADRYAGRDGTSIPEFMNAMYQTTPYGYVFSEWGYENKYTAIKGVMYSVARFKEPAAIAGNNGQHWYLIVGGGANRDPYTYYGTRSSIQYLYVYDSRERSPLYDNGQGERYYKILRKGQRYSPDEVINNWTRIPWYDLKYRSIERNSYAAWGAQGATYYNRAVFYSY